MMNVSKIALVTGGSRGIGKSISIALAKSGVKVALSYKSNRGGALEVIKEINDAGGEAIDLEIQLEDRNSIKRAIKKVESTWGNISILINNAAIAQEKSFEEITEKDWDLMLKTNLRGPFICCQECLPNMRSMNWGRIINISSIGGQWGGINQVHYAASKAGLINLTKSIARLYSKDGITSNAIAIGLVMTDMSRREIESKEGKIKQENIPCGRLGIGEDIGSAVNYLVSEGGSYVTGQTLNINGGMYLG